MILNHSKLKKPNKTIGILGGMGPAASANLYQKIVSLAQEKYQAKQDYDYPPMIIYNLPLIGFDETGFTDPKLVKEQLILGVKKLEQAGSDLIIIACNTVYLFYNEMQSAINIPLINLIEETIKEVKADNKQIVGLLASQSTNKLKIYAKEINKNDIKLIEVTSQQQMIINNIILKVMAGEQSIQDAVLLNEIIDYFKKQGADSVILGCTELPLAINQSDVVGIKLYDAVDILAKAALKKAYSHPLIS